MFGQKTSWARKALEEYKIRVLKVRMLKRRTLKFGCKRSVSSSPLPQQNFCQIITIKLEQQSNVLNTLRCRCKKSRLGLWGQVTQTVLICLFSFVHSLHDPPPPHHPPVPRLIIWGGGNSQKSADLYMSWAAFETIFRIRGGFFQIFSIRRQQKPSNCKLVSKLKMFDSLHNPFKTHRSSVAILPFLKNNQCTQGLKTAVCN